MLLNTALQPAAVPQRIVSLVPSQTELLHTLGLEEHVCGITRYCIHPPQWQQTKTIIGGTKKINENRLRALQPDLIIANREENLREQVERLSADYPVWVTDVHDFNSALEMITDIGRLTGKSNRALELCLEIRNVFSRIPKPKKKYQTAYLIWKDPYMSVGGDTFIHDMLERCGFENSFTDQRRYPTVTPETLRERGCELLLLSSEPYPFSDTHINELQQILPETKILLVNGEMFSWYGSRMLQAAGYFAEFVSRLD